MIRTSFVTLLVLTLTACATSSKKESPTADPLAVGKKAIDAMTGCYLVDYSYTETDSLKKGYSRDNRVYDVNKVKSAKEWIYTDEISPTRVRLQHILFATDASGKLIEGTELKHQTEDWEYGASHLYDFVGPKNWQARPLDSANPQWIRRITSLDDGLRYQCAASWRDAGDFQDWTCDNYAPIPGRETRDMGRKDYQTLQRSTRLVVYQPSWLERQENVKTIHDEKNRRTPLAKEAGKIWYVRLPDSECSVVRDFVRERRDFWALLRETWDEVYAERTDFLETSPAKDAPPRFVRMGEIEKKYMGKDLSDKNLRAQARAEILKLIESYRVPSSNVARSHN